MNLDKILNKKINVLFLGGGRRNSLAKRFKNFNCNIFSYEVEDHPPIEKEAIILNGLKWSDKNVKDDIVSKIKEHNIDIIIPLQDKATLIAYQISREFNIVCPTSSYNVNNICLNKKEFEKHCEGYIHEIYPSVRSDSKVIKKPVEGCNSKGIQGPFSYEEYINDPDLNNNNFVYQKFLNSGKEYSVDAFFDKDSNLIGAVPRERIIVQGGEVAKSKTLNRSTKVCNDLIESVKIFGNSLPGISGPFCIQFILDEFDSPKIIEANSRFGGGVILSLEAGFDMIKYIIYNHYFKISIDLKNSSWKEDLVMYRYFDEHFYEDLHI